MKDTEYQSEFDFRTQTGGTFVKNPHYIQYMLDFGESEVELDVGQVWDRKFDPNSEVVDTSLFSPEWEKVVVESFGTDIEGHECVDVKSVTGVPRGISYSMFKAMYYRCA